MALLLLWPLFLVALSSGAESPSPAPPGAKPCTGIFTSPVKNLCLGKFPDKHDPQVWVVLFYAPWCGHCRAMEPKYQQLAKELMHEKQLSFGAIDCPRLENRDICMRYGVRGYPSLQVLVDGNNIVYNRARETDVMKAFVLNILKNKDKAASMQQCAAGLFESQEKDAVLPRCEAKFPSVGDKRSWLVLLYNKNATGAEKFRQDANKAAQELGNDPPAAGEAAQKPMVQRERLRWLADRYDFSVSLPKRGLNTSEPLAKIGAICCDCPGQEDYCAGLLPADRKWNATQGPGVLWVSNGAAQKAMEGVIEDAGTLVELVVARLGYHDDYPPDKENSPAQRSGSVPTKKKRKKGKDAEKATTPAPPRRSAASAAEL